MKLKTWHLFAVIIMLFVCSFIVINQKFDKFYRVNGINNDNRVLLETYLDEDEQTYLVDNQIHIDLFIEYIKSDDFHLINYQYYNALKETKRYQKKSDILNVGNSLSTRLTYLYNGEAFQYAQKLIDSDLEKAFLNDVTFQFQYIDFYKNMKRLYRENDYTFIQDTSHYVDVLKERGIVKHDDVLNVFEQVTTAYNATSLKMLMNKNLADNVELVYAPYELSTIVDRKHYISTYEPNDLLLLQDIPRVRYAMYLQSDTYNALTKMYQTMNKEVKGFLLKDAYMSPQVLKSSEVGYKEEQLGFTINVTKSEVAYKDFELTDVSRWLEQHAYEYGFILRYPKNKASITNHQYNPHIYRYVGKSLAKSLHDSNLTLEEYIMMGE